jgi:C4-type Zn-finger protein
MTHLTPEGFAIELGAVGLFLTTMTGIYIQIRMLNKQNAKMDAANSNASAQRETIAKNVEEVHKATNSMKDELVKSTAAASRAQGIDEGRKLEQADTKTPEPSP